MSEVAWRPSPERVERANVTAFMKKHGIATLPELIERSQKDAAWFWGAMERDLGIAWQQPYTQVLDTSQGKAWARWFVGGTTNITANCVDRHARGPRADKRAIVWEGEDGDTRTWTYRELQMNVDQLAGALRARGIGPGQAVGVYLPMLPETAAALLAIAKVGAIFVPLFSGFGAEAIEKRLSDAGASMLLTCDGFLRKGQPVLMKPTADAALAKLPGVKHVLVLRRLGNAQVEVQVEAQVNARVNAQVNVPAARQAVTMQAGRDEDWEQAVANMPPRALTLPVDSEHPWMVIYTSGTTGRPKGSVHVHGGFLVKIAQEVLHQTDLHDDDVITWLTDMGWIMGPWLVVGGLALGGTVLLYEGSPDWPDPGRLWQVVAKHRVTVLGVSPTLIRSLMKHGDAWPAKHDLASLRTLASTGETWNPEPWRWLFEKVGQGRCPIINLSGGTEVGACFLSPTPASSLKPCSLGHPALGMAVDIVDEHGAPVKPGEVGELVCREPWPGMTRGLWKDPERYLETYWSRFPGMWYHGDFASVDAEGEWFLHGRSDDTIKIAGKRLGPAEVESILVDTGLVAECAAVGIADPVKGEALHCYAILRPGVAAEAATEARLAEAVEKALGKPFRPRGIHFVPDLPRTRNAKILRRAVRAVASGKEPGDLTSLANPEALRTIKKVV